VKRSVIVRWRSCVQRRQSIVICALTATVRLSINADDQVFVLRWWRQRPG